MIIICFHLHPRLHVKVTVESRPIQRPSCSNLPSLMRPPAETSSTMMFSRPPRPICRVNIPDLTPSSEDDLFYRQLTSQHSRFGASARTVVQAPTKKLSLLSKVYLRECDRLISLPLNDPLSRTAKPDCAPVEGGSSIPAATRGGYIFRRAPSACPLFLRVTLTDSTRPS